MAIDQYQQLAESLFGAIGLICVTSSSLVAWVQEGEQGQGGGCECERGG